LIVIDGYNLIGQAAGTLSGVSLEKERRALIRQVEKLSQITGEKALIVFDGSSKSSTSEPKTPVTIAYSKSGQTADGWILKYLSRRPKGSVILITADRELTHKARKLGFKVEQSLNQLEAKAQPYLTPSAAEAQATSDLLTSISPQSREALAQIRKKSKRP